MAIEKGSVSIEAQNIMPVIKRWLYSDKDIFLREVVSNSCDAITKYRMLHLGTEEDMRVTVTVDKEKGEIRIADTGIGMTDEEVRRYINQVAFSGANDFLEKYKDSGEQIIGHFGLGFYSAFMVSGTVEIQTLSYQEGAKPVHWISSGEEEYEIEDGDRTEHGTAIIMNIAEDEQEFLQEATVSQVLLPLYVLLRQAKRQQQI